MSLADMKCAPCRGGMPPMSSERAQKMLTELSSGWEVNEAGHLERTYTFKNLATALEFANTVGSIAEAEGHHPDLHIAWGKCKVEVWTHAIHGLTENDFYLAAKADRAYDSMANGGFPSG
ncbi:MAG TPA: 4a-hydroxytetrahydrobiopterin dehydratase [Candidatus Methylomirabilis sp.]|nr:4a-hydroxytetrahydrobiopterin dehydratase [Candidatus Methylomirabilis sp.]